MLNSMSIVYSESWGPGGLEWHRLQIKFSEDAGNSSTELLYVAASTTTCYIHVMEQRLCRKGKGVMQTINSKKKTINSKKKTYFFTLHEALCVYRGAFQVTG